MFKVIRAAESLSASAANSGEVLFKNNGGGYRQSDEKCWWGSQKNLSSPLSEQHLLASRLPACDTQTRPVRLARFQEFLCFSLNGARQSLLCESRGIGNAPSQTYQYWSPWAGSWTPSCPDEAKLENFASAEYSVAVCGNACCGTTADTRTV